MTVHIPPLSRQAHRFVLMGAAAITLASVAASELVTLIVSAIFGLEAGLPAYLVSGIVPILLAGPGSYWQLKRLEQVRAAYSELERIAATDWLTGCLNRRAFTDRAAAVTMAGTPSALLVIDADGFKSVNDRFGHDHGDEALRGIAKAISTIVPEAGVVGRLGGEEFGIYLAGADSGDAHKIAEAICEAVQDIAFSPEGAAHTLTVSVGVATTSIAMPFAQLFKLADRQLYEAKANGRNCVAIAAASDAGELRAA